MSKAHHTAVLDTEWLFALRRCRSRCTRKHKFHQIPAHRDETIDSKDQELLVPHREKKEYGQKREGLSERHQQEDQKGSGRQQKIKKTR